MSRLRRPFLSDRYFFVTIRLRKDRAILNESDFKLLALAFSRARLMNWKLRFANYNLDFYNPGDDWQNYFLYRPELYNLDDDPAESYDVAYRNSEIVASIMKQVESMIHTFPANIQSEFRAAKSRVGSPLTQIGRYPMPQGYKRPGWVYISKRDFQEQP